ncbi:hypothetical protein WDJ51_06295 [Rathayibacter sp. YIM 133350]|uniref:hypothetical protein n=1 Tax=Rathayibacter sp. YIM 133350 TaxID=3131992 RepID=UPI00307F1D8E
MEPRLRAELLNELRESARLTGLDELVDPCDGPLALIDPAGARERLAELKRALPFVRFSVAVAALPHPAIVQALWGEADFSLSSAADLRLLADAAVPADGALFTRPVATSTERARAYAAGARTFVIDSPSEVDRLLELPKDVRVLVRLATPRSADPSVYGIAPENALHLVRYALSRGVNISGVSFHLAEAARSAVVLEAALRSALDVIDSVRRVLGVHLDVLDIGGGFAPSAAHRAAELSAQSAIIRRVLAPRLHSLSVIAEPGRYIASGCAFTLVHVIGHARHGARQCAYLDEGVFGLFGGPSSSAGSPALFGLAEALGATERLHPTTVVGPSGSGSDIIAAEELLPALAAGDTLVVPHVSGRIHAPDDRIVVVPVSGEAVVAGPNDAQPAIPVGIQGERDGALRVDVGVRVA